MEPEALRQPPENDALACDILSRRDRQGRIYNQLPRTIKEQGLRTTPTILSLAMLLGMSPLAALAADLEIKDPWVRGTVSGQQATGAFMEITSKSGAVLVGAASPVAGVTEIHEMKMDGGVMKMRAVARLELPAGKPVVLGPGGYHVMLINLKQPLKKGDAVPLTLQVEGKDKKVETVEVKAEVRDLTASASPASQHKP
jgi:copper(I)-binding protein